MVDELQVGSNLAHLALDMANLHLKARLLQRGPWSLALSGGAMWLDLGRAGTLPEIEPDVDEALRGVDVLILPISAVASMDRPGLGLDVAAGWDQCWVAGRPSSQVLVLDGAVGVRRAWLAAGGRGRLHRRPRPRAGLGGQLACELSSPASCEPS